MSQKESLCRLCTLLRAAQEHKSYRGTIIEGVATSEYTSFRIGGIAPLFARPHDIPSLCLLLRLAKEYRVPVILLGMGSNVLLPDGELSSLVITTRDLCGMEINGTKVTAECGLLLNALILRAAAADLGGYELLYGIPATVGGATYMNAGAHGVAFGDRVASVELYNTETDRFETYAHDALAFSYRKSILHTKKNLILTRVTLSLLPTEEDVVRARVRDVVHRRALTQPLAMPSAGSAFLRPCESSEVWRLIDACGLRGFRIGGAAVSEKHAGFIVNCGGATAADVRALMAHIRAAVYARHGFSLIPEICIFEDPEA